MTFTELVSEVMARLNLTSSEAQARVGRSLNAHYKRVTSAIGLVVSRRVVVSATTTDGNALLQFQGIEKVISVFTDTPPAPRRVLDEVTYDQLRNNPEPTGSITRYAISRMGAHHVEVLLGAPPIGVLTFKADGHERAQVLSGTMEPAFPESFHDILVEAVLADELRKQEKLPLATLADQTRERRLSDLRMWIAKSGYLRVRQGDRVAGDFARAISGGGIGKHAYTHETGGNDQITKLDGGVITSGTVADARLPATIVRTTDPRLSDPRTPLAHHTTHEPGGSDALTDLSATTLTSGTVPDARLAANIVRATDPRLSDARAPTAHAPTHTVGGGDPLAVTALAGFPGGIGSYLRADGTFAVPPTGGLPGGATTNVQFNDAGVFAGDAGLTFEKTGNMLSVGGPVQVSGTPLAALVPNSLSLSYEPSLLSSRVLAAGPDTATTGELRFVVGNTSGGGQQQMVLKATGFVGIGTVTPGAKLEVKQSANGVGGSLRLVRSDTMGYSDVYMGGDNALYLHNNSVGYVSLDQAGLLSLSGNMLFLTDGVIRRNVNTGFVVLAGGVTENESQGAVLLLAGNAMSGGLAGCARVEIGNAAGAKFYVERSDTATVFEVSGATGDTRIYTNLALLGGAGTITVQGNNEGADAIVFSRSDGSNASSLATSAFGKALIYKALGAEVFRIAESGKITTKTSSERGVTINGTQSMGTLLIFQSNGAEFGGIGSRAVSGSGSATDMVVYGTGNIYLWSQGQYVLPHTPGHHLGHPTSRWGEVNAGHLNLATSSAIICDLDSTATYGGYLQMRRSGAVHLYLGHAAALISSGLYSGSASAVRSGGVLVLASDTDEVSSPPIYNNATANPVNINVDNGGMLRRSTSTRRAKHAIEPLTVDWSRLLALQPVSFRTNDTNDARVGLIAEDVALVDARLAISGPHGFDEVAYTHLTAPLLAAIQDLHARLAALEGRTS